MEVLGADPDQADHEPPHRALARGSPRAPSLGEEAALCGGFFADG